MPSIRLWRRQQKWGRGKAVAEKMRFSPKQLKVMTWWQSDEWEAIICDGAIRSGKTFVMGLSFILWAMRFFDGRQFGMCGKTIGSLRRNLLAELIPSLRKLGMSVQEKRSENLLTVRYKGRENNFLLFGGRDESSASLIQGSTLAGILMDETALMPRSFVEQAIARCSVPGSRLWFNCNPEGPNHWFYQEWILKAKERRVLRLHFTMEDNPTLSVRIRERYQRAYSGIFYQRFVLGEWIAAQGRVYDFFEPEQDAVDLPAEPFETWRISVDYGTTNPASFGLWGKKDGIWYRATEYYYDSRREGHQKTDAEYVDALERLAAGREIQRVIVDPSAASFIEALRRRGFYVVKADNAVSDGIRVTADLLRSGQIRICRGCEDCLREIAVYRWDYRNQKDVPRKEDDHAMDEMRYFAMDLLTENSEGFVALAVERRC